MNTYQDLGLLGKEAVMAMLLPGILMILGSLLYPQETLEPPSQTLLWL
jgi:hypothetical protein